MNSNLLTPVAQHLLGSIIPARLAFVGANGDPYFAPIWFLWRNERFLLCSRANSLRSFADRQRKATYESLSVRGMAEIEVIEGLPVECIECANRYYGNENGQQCIAWVRGYTN